MTNTARVSSRILRRQRTYRPPTIYGRVARIEEAYPREVRVPGHVLMVVLAAASIVRAVGGLLGALLPGRGTGAGPSWRDLRKGPEFLVTPILLRDADDRLVPMEIHGHMSDGALAPGDRIVVDLGHSRDSMMPARAVRIENLATGRILRPRGATLWSHLGVGLLLQALLGAALLGLLLFCLLGRVWA
jgi:hypothetical protein